MATLRAIALSLAVPTGCSSATDEADTTDDDSPAYVDLPDGAVGIGLDDLRFSVTLDRIVVAAGRTGAVDLVEPDTLEVEQIKGFSYFPDFDGGDLRGPESADEGRGLVFANDRSDYTLRVVDPVAKSIVASVQLETTEPDYVRWVEPTGEVWITNPGMHRIEVLAVPDVIPPTPVHSAFIAVPTGVEGLAIDPPRMSAYVHSSGGVITVIDIESREVVTEWATDCSSEHGIPVVDEDRGLVFAGCGHVEVKVLDANADGKVLGSYALGTGTTILAYSASLRHFYLRGDPGTEVAILGIPDSGVPELLGTLTTPNKGHCATADDRGYVWICDWEMGRLVRFIDPYPATE